MFENAKTFHGLGVDDLDAAREFYGDTLGLTVTVRRRGQRPAVARAPRRRRHAALPQPRPQVGNYTVLNFSVDDIDATVDELTARGVQFERYDDSGQDEKGIARGLGPDIAWFKDPAGHTLSVLHRSPS